MTDIYKKAISKLDNNFLILLKKLIFSQKPYKFPVIVTKIFVCKTFRSLYNAKDVCNNRKNFRQNVISDQHRVMEMKPSFVELYKSQISQANNKM